MGPIANVEGRVLLLCRGVGPVANVEGVGPVANVEGVGPVAIYYLFFYEDTAVQI